MKHFILILLFLTTSLVYGQAVNDECVDRITVTAGVGDFLIYSVDMAEATESLDSSCDSASNDNLDVWYEITMPVSGNLRVSNIPSTVTATIYDSCGGVELQCFNNDGYFYNLVNGTTYVLRIAERSTFAGPLDFRLEAFASAVNDECAMASAISLTTSAATVVNANFSAASESVDASCESGSNNNQDLWYTFTMPVNGHVRITSIPGTVSRTLYSSCGAAELACGFDDGYFYNLPIGTTYTLRLAERTLFAGPVEFNIQAFEVPLNDYCVNALPISVSTADFTEYTVDTRTASESINSSCESAANVNQDLWYEFNMPVDGHVRITNIPNTITFSIFDSCGGTEQLCFNDDGYFYDLTSGTDYVLRVSERSVFTGEFTMRLQAFEEIANNECTDRLSLVIPTDTPLNVAADMRQASESTDSSCETASNTNHDIWYELTMPVSGNLYFSGVNNLVRFTLYDDCATEIPGYCSNDDTFFNGLNESDTYILRVGQRAVFSDPIDFDVLAVTEVPNNECADATTMVVGTVSPITYDINIWGTSESTDSSCETASNVNMDMWFVLTMPVDGELQLSGVPSLMNLTLYDSCGGSELGCFSNDGSFTGLTAATDYVLRVSQREVFASISTIDVLAVPAALSACSGTTTFSSGSWSSGAPDKTTAAVIASDYDTASLGSIDACECTINSGSTLTIGANDYLQTSFDITVDGDLVVAHEGSVVQRDLSALTINNGSIEVQKTTPVLAAKDFMLMGSPMSAESRDGVYNAAWRVYGHDTANFLPNPDVTLAFPLAENFIDDNGDDRVLLGTTDAIDAGTGYLVFPQSSPTEAGLSYDLSYTGGTLNSGNIAYAVGYNGSRDTSFNLLGNPYASAIDAVDFIQANGMVDAVYFWEHNTSPSAGLPGYLVSNYSMEDVSIFNLTGGIAASSSPTEIPEQFIASGQGFAIKATAAGSAEFNNNMRRNFGNTSFKSAVLDSDIQTTKIWLNLSEEQFKLGSSTLVGFLEEASASFEPAYDAKRLATYVSLYSQTKDGDELGIQGLGSFNTDAVIVLGMSSQLRGDHLFKLSLDQFEGLNAAKNEIYLLDTQTGQWTNLFETDYEFQASEGNHAHRFELHFKSPELLNLAIASKVYPNPTSGVITLQTTEPIGKVILYDLVGRELWQEYGNTERIQIDLSRLPKATYVLRYQTANGWNTKRVVRH